MTDPVLILGCGYLGERVAQQWHAAGRTVYTVTRSPDRAETFAQAGYIPLLGDVMQPDSLRLPPDVTTILYAIGLDRTTGHSQRAVYVTGLQHALASLTNCGVSQPRVLYISSTSVYGESAGEWITSETPAHPTKESGHVCLEAETVLRDWAHTHTAPATVLRLAGIYGPGRLLSRAASLRQQTPLSGCPQAWLNLIHVDDAVTAVLAAERNITAGNTWLVADTEPVPRGVYYSHLAALVNAPPPVFSAPDDPERNKRCDSRTTQATLNWQLRYPTYREGLAQAMSTTPV